MLRVVRRWWYRPPIRMGSVDNSRIQTTRTRNAQFISYLVESGFRQVNADHYEAGLRRRRAATRLLFWSLVIGGAWLVVESARALSMY
jgi:hypothetical protein